jgi:hypothetical protein
MCPQPASRQQGAPLPTLEPLEDRNLLSGLPLLSIVPSGALSAPVRQLTAGGGAPLLGPAQVSIWAGGEVRLGGETSASLGALMAASSAAGSAGVGLGLSLGAAAPLGGVLPGDGLGVVLPPAGGPAVSAAGGAAADLSPAGDTSALTGPGRGMTSTGVVLPSERAALPVESSFLALLSAGWEAGPQAGRGGAGEELLPAFRPGADGALPAVGAGSAAPADEGEAGAEGAVSGPGVAPEELPRPEGVARATAVGGGARAELLGPVSDFFPLALERLGSAARQARDALADLEEPAGGWWVYGWALTLAAVATVSEAIHRRLRPAPESGPAVDGWGGPGLV